MKVRIVGTHNFASRDTRLGCLLVDGVLALDAGSLSVGLTFDEQRLVRAVLISHKHYDHIRDLMTIGLSATRFGTTIDVYGIAPTVRALETQFFESGLYPNPAKSPSPDKPAMRLHVLEPYEKLEIAGYTVQATPVVHAVEATGYEVAGPDGKRIFYSGDTGPGVANAWPHIRPDMAFIECSLSNDQDERAAKSVHLQPKTFAEALVKFREVHGYLPRVVAVHLYPFSDDVIRRELPAAAAAIDADITVASEDDVFEV